MPLSDEREAGIRQASEDGSVSWDDPITDARELLAAYDEQRAEIERLRVALTLAQKLLNVNRRARVNAEAENERLRAKVADAWGNGYREGVQDGESGYVAGTDRRLRWTPNPHLATCEHTEHAIGSGGRVGRTFQGTSDPAGRWERCDGHEVHDV